MQSSVCCICSYYIQKKAHCQTIFDNFRENTGMLQFRKVIIGRIINLNETGLV